MPDWASSWIFRATRTSPAEAEQELKMCTLELGGSSSQEAPRLGRRVCGSRRAGGKSDHIQVVGAAVKRLQILVGGRDRRTGGPWPLPSSARSRAPWSKEGIVYHDVCSPTRHGQRDADKAVLPELGRRLTRSKLSTMILKLIAGTLLYHNEIRLRLCSHCSSGRAEKVKGKPVNKCCVRIGGLHRPAPVARF